MGPINSKLGSAGQLHGEAKLAASKFDTDEIHVLRATWQDLADRTGGKGIDKETFLQYFPLNGLLGDRLFAQFDTKGTGFIDFDEFVTGLAIVCRGTLDDKIHFIFNMYDVSHDKSVSKQELATLLNQVPKDVLATSSIIPGLSSGYISSDGNDENGLHDIAEDEDMTPGAHGEFEEVDNYTNHDMVEKAFEECDLNHEGRLTYEEFKMWVQRNPSIVKHIESILPYNGPKDLHRHVDKTETLPHMKRVSSIARISERMSMSNLNLQEVAGEVFNHTSSIRRTTLTRDVSSRSRGMSLMSYSNSTAYAESPPILHRENSTSSSVSNDKDLMRRGSFTESQTDHEETARAHLIQAMELTQSESVRASIGAILDSMPGGRAGTVIVNDKQLHNEVYHTIVAMEDYLWKKGKSFLHMLSKRYYLLSGNCMYYYASKNDIRPKGVIFLTGCIIERFKDEDMALKGYYGFELLHPDLSTGEHHRHDQRVLYCRNEEDREKWVVALQHAAHVVPIEDEYVIGKELGRGRFSIVCECVHKVTGEHFAVKIIDKNTIEKDEKELLRTEIAVLKLVNHPNIIRMEGLYESKQYIYIVMEMLKGGELFERIVGRPRFSEVEAAKLLRPLLESVAYLHDLGIVHRDLKPENILCGEELEDLKIADFGLSKMILPKEKMDAACGTLSYVAPEVLTMQGYGKEADLWSVGVIMFLLLCGKLPFDGDDHNEIIRSTIQADLKVNPAVWAKLSDEAKSLMTSLLNKSPKDRITAREALKHPFMLAHRMANENSRLSSRGLGAHSHSNKSLKMRTGDETPRASTRPKSPDVGFPIGSQTPGTPQSMVAEPAEPSLGSGNLTNAEMSSSYGSMSSLGSVHILSPSKIDNSKPEMPRADAINQDSKTAT